MSCDISASYVVETICSLQEGNPDLRVRIVC